MGNAASGGEVSNKVGHMWGRVAVMTVVDRANG